MTVAALYVDVEAGPYAGMAGVDAWGVERDAKLYRGPGPVVAHPPRGPWGKLAWNCTKQDPTCGPVAVAQTLQYGGVLEHPEGSRLWPHCGLPKPFRALPTFAPRVWSLIVSQCDWGHRAQKATALLFVGVDPRGVVLPPPREPTHYIGTSAADRGGKPCLPKKERHITPPAFAEWLVALARTARSDLRAPSRGA